jgi:trimeric autotransporter adhesin
VMVTTGEVGSDGVFRASGRGTSRAATTEGSYQIGAESTLTGSGTNFVGGRMPESFVQSGHAGEARLFPTGSGDYTFQQTGTRVANPVLATRESTILVGYAAGLVDGVRSDGRPVEPYALLGGSGGTVATDPGSVIISTDATNGHLGAIFQMTDAGPRGTQAPPGADIAMFFGFEPGRSAYVDSTRFAAIDTSLLPATITTAGSTQNATRTELYMVSSGLAPTLPGGVQACQCQFVQWGWWGATIGGVTDGNVQRVDRVHMGNWVAGPLITTSDMPTTGSASYAGHAVGSVLNAGARYQAAGTFAASFDFGSRTGNMTISNFDGMTLSGTMTGNGSSYSTNLSVSGRSGLTGNAVGSFYSGAGDPVRETGGQFGVRPATTTSTPYGAAGIFVGKKQ